MEMLTKQTLFDLLSSRFTVEKKLSDIPDPALLQDGIKAAKKIAAYIKEGKKITIIGDYDVDGVSSSAIMGIFFRQIPYDVDIIIPNRFKDGYGLNPTVLQRIDTDLIITVDNGISATDASKICKQRNIELIITDHHTPQSNLPDAYAIVNPKLPTCPYPFKEICGAQVAWLLLALLKREMKLDIDMKQFIDTLAIAIIADIMPLIDINRALVKKGLELLSYSEKPSSIIIRDFLNKENISSEDIAFQISPRINSAGRLKDASIALDFFMAQTTFEAYQNFEKLNILNETRKEIEAQTTFEAEQLVKGDEDIIVVAKEGWHEGVVGIVASRLVDKFEKPSIVLSINDKIAKGSARSFANINIYELIQKNKKKLLKFGGHKMAAGLSLDTDMLDSFISSINTSASTIDKKSFIPENETIGILDTDEIDFELLEILEKFEPYGEANPKPKFLLQDAEILDIKPLGKEKLHSKITFKQNKKSSNTFELLAFRTSFQMPKSKKISCCYTLNKNFFNSKVSIQLLVSKIYK